MKEISIDELLVLPRDSYELIDIRDEELTLYGMIPGAVNINIDALEDNEKINRIPKNKKLVFYCQIGRRSREIEDLDSLNGRECLSLKEGYMGYIRSGILVNGNNEEIQHKAEECIRKKFHKQLFDFDKATLVDLREPDEVLVSGIEGAINMPFSGFPKGIDDIPKDKPVYVYCREGSFSEEVADILADRGSEIAFQVSSCFQWKGTG